MLRSALLALLLSLPVAAAQPEGALSLGARFDGSSFSGLWHWPAPGSACGR